MAPGVEQGIIAQVKIDIGSQARPTAQSEKPLLFSTEQSNPGGSSLAGRFEPSPDGLLALLDKLDQFGEEKFYIEMSEEMTCILSL